MQSWSLWPYLLLPVCCEPFVNLASDAAEPIDRGCPASAETAASSAIRSPDAPLRALLIDGCRRSPTLQRLADAIGRTDGVVYVSIGPCPLRSLRGCLLHAIADTGNARYMWIRLSADTDLLNLVSTLAHELQHALEVLGRSTIRSPRDLLDFYQSGESQAFSSTTPASPFRTYETRAAIAVAAVVRAELAAPLATSADDRE